MEQKHRPQWWQVYLTAPVMLGALILQAKLAGSESTHSVLELGILLVGFGWMALWVHLNQGALQDQEMIREGWKMCSDPDAQPDLDPHHLPLAQVSGDTDQDLLDAASITTKGRYN